MQTTLKSRKQNSLKRTLLAGRKPIFKSKKKGSSGCADKGFSTLNYGSDEEVDDDDDLIDSSHNEQDTTSSRTQGKCKCGSVK